MPALQIRASIESLAAETLNEEIDKIQYSAVSDEDGW